MLSDLELKLELLRLADGDIDRAQTMYEWMYPPAALRTPEVETDTIQDRVEPLLDPIQQVPDQSSSQTIPSAFLKGLTAAMEGQIAADNPYDFEAQHDEYEEWLSGFISGSPSAPAQPDPADLPPPTEAEFNALEKLDAEPSEFISDLTGDPAVEPESGLHGEAVETVSELDPQAEGTGDRVEQEKFEAHKHGGEAGFWATRLFGKPKVEA